MPASSGNHSIWNIWSTGIQTPTGPTSANGQTTYTYSDAGHSMVFRNGGMIQSFVPPNYYFLPTAGATPTQYVNGAVLYYQSKCWSSGAQQTESVGWLDQYPTLSTESFSFNHFGGCGFPIVIDMTAAASVLEPRQIPRKHGYIERRSTLTRVRVWYLCVGAHVCCRAAVLGPAPRWRRTQIPMISPAT